MSETTSSDQDLLLFPLYAFLILFWGMKGWSAEKCTVYIVPILHQGLSDEGKIIVFLHYELMNEGTVSGCI